ncbi:isopenicillin N synthase family oxygenase [Pseudomonas chengduensis]|nr:2OG-Fe(II) oxygenase family protein [Pseudomonas chengduensis]MDH0625655.1 isopenicillin N synthase family oxygenase [Pseudomonas chengduensis]MDH1214004.1 isopenicillin N synthase family oxygenase [Pseudomonas chengduensis]MDH1283325.1 isopenicillin N synthase family oxygenase [Pseudomonas chengduensis]MDH1668084.1 isopenicillin N synthase family oxygenase [Pseudomonas chengduensis]MDH1684269.1 isopenicillin N synthase family oxygenase [Pseudomonas chengduensis]
MHEQSPYALAELNKEARMGAMGSENDAREVRRIDLSDFDRRKAEITDELWRASVEVGFFQLYNHGIDLAEVRAAFATMERFFALPQAVKAQYPLKKGCNAGWESKAQVRPSTGTPDQKESYQITRPHMAGLWPNEAELAGFRETMLAFEAQCWTVGMRVLSCFAERLGFAEDFFTRAHDPAGAGYQSTLRLLHYFPIADELKDRLGLWRAGAHTDFDCLTLLFQRQGQGGLQVCPGKEMEDAQWTSIEPAEEVITCNIGDMLMRWSDDQLPSNFHRVRNPRPDEYQGSRYSLAFFCQANREVMIEGPGGKYPAISAEDYLYQRVNANFARY